MARVQLGDWQRRDPVVGLLVLAADGVPLPLVIGGVPPGGELGRQRRLPRVLAVVPFGRVAVALRRVQHRLHERRQRGRLEGRGRGALHGRELVRVGGRGRGDDGRRHGERVAQPGDAPRRRRPCAADKGLEQAPEALVLRFTPHADHLDRLPLLKTTFKISTAGINLKKKQKKTMSDWMRP